MASTAIRVLEAQARTYRHVWRASVFSSFLSPALYLLAMGLGLGSLVDQGDAARSFPGGSYLAFLAPGLLAATAMQTGAGETSWPVMGGIRWARTYHAALATPVAPRDIVRGRILWTAIRLVMVTTVFAAVMVLFGATGPVAGFAAVPPAILTGMAFAPPVFAYTARLEDETGLSNLYRFGIVPLFLFSGTFFPVSQLPDWLEPVAYATPLWHGVELARAAALGDPAAFPVAAHVGYLVALAAVGEWFAERNLHRRLVS